MSAEVVDFVARLSATKRRMHAARQPDTMADGAAPSHDLEGDHSYSNPSGHAHLMDLQLALVELRAELVKKQAELFAEGMSVPEALSIGAQAEVIMIRLTELASEIRRLERTE